MPTAWSDKDERQYDHVKKIARDRGKSEEQETAVPAFASELTQTGDIEPRTADAVLTFLDDAQLVTLSATVALANFTNRVNHRLDIELP